MTVDERQQNPQERWSHRTVSVDGTTLPPEAIEFVQDTRELVRERPVAAVLAAAGLGFLVARFVSMVRR